MDTINIQAGLPVALVADVINSLLPDDPNAPVSDELCQFMQRYYAGKHGMDHLLQDLRSMGRGCKTRIRAFVEHKVAIGVDSPPEADLVKALREEGFKVTPQFRLGKYRWDVGLKGLKVVIDVDSKQYHLHDEKAFVVDRWKANSGVMSGWIALRVTATCVNTHLKKILELLKEIRRLKKTSPKKFPKIDVGPVWQWHSNYAREWEHQNHFDENYNYT